MATIILHFVDPVRYSNEIFDIISLHKDKAVVYVTTNKTHTYLVESLQKRGFSIENFFFIDCITKQIHEPPPCKNCAYVDSPYDLTSISIEIDERIKEENGGKVLILDSLSALLIYNDANTIAKFVNLTVNKLRSEGIDGSLISLSSDANKDVIKQVISFVDEIQGKI